jgi:colicin import membrane protein
MGNITALGGTLPLLTKTISNANTIDTMLNGNRTTRARDELNQSQLIERNRLAEQVAIDQATRNTALLNVEQSEKDRKRALTLKRAIARQRAVYGGSGIDDGGNDGSGEAVIFGLTNESEQDRAASDSIYTLRRRIIDDNVNNIRKRNLLDEAQNVTRRKVKRINILPRGLL